MALVYDVNRLVNISSFPAGHRCKADDLMPSETDTQYTFYLVFRITFIVKVMLTLATNGP